MDTYISKRGQKSRRARSKDRRERRYLAECERVWSKPLVLMPWRTAQKMSARITPRTGALLEEWRETQTAPAALVRVLAVPERQPAKCALFSSAERPLRITG